MYSVAYNFKNNGKGWDQGPGKDQDESTVRNGARDQPWQCPAARNPLSGVLRPPPVGSLSQHWLIHGHPTETAGGKPSNAWGLTWERDWISLVEIQEADKQHLLPQSVKERCDKKPAFIGSLLCVGRSANYLLSYEMLPKLIRGLLLPPFYRWGNWSMQKLNSSPGSSGDLGAIFEQKDWVQSLPASGRGATDNGPPVSERVQPEAAEGAPSRTVQALLSCTETSGLSP